MSWMFWLIYAIDFVTSPPFLVANAFWSIGVGTYLLTRRRHTALTQESHSEQHH